MLTLKMKKTLATNVASLALAGAVFAAERTLPTPPASSCPDTESSLCVPLPDWPGLGRHVKLTLSANFTPSNCVQVAFGQDTDSNGDLEPEETHLVLGVDCGAPFIREEVNIGKWRSGVLAASTEEPTLDSTPTPSTFTFAWRQPSAVAKRCTHAKITTRGRGDSAAQIAAEVTRPGVALFIR